MTITYPLLYDRAWLCARWTVDKLNLRQIGERAGGASRERVRQVLNKYDLIAERTATCVQCRQPYRLLIVDPRGNNKPKFCSPRCYETWWRTRKARRMAAIRIQVTCVWCGTVSTRRSSHSGMTRRARGDTRYSGQTFCNQRCFHAMCKAEKWWLASPRARGGAPRTILTCHQCGNVFCRLRSGCRAGRSFCCRSCFYKSQRGEPQTRAAVGGEA